MKMKLFSKRLVGISEFSILIERKDKIEEMYLYFLAQKLSN